MGVVHLNYNEDGTDWWFVIASQKTDPRSIDQSVLASWAILENPCEASAAEGIRVAEFLHTLGQEDSADQKSDQRRCRRSIGTSKFLQERHAGALRR
jgi:hypothetical protein